MGQYLTFERPFACECACLSRSLMAIKHGEKTVAEVFHPFFCCRDNFLVRAPDSGELWYTVTAGHCLSQPGLYCTGCPCETCMEIEFNIYEGDTDKVVGKMNSRFPGCAKSCCTD